MSYLKCATVIGCAIVALSLGSGTAYAEPPLPCVPNNGAWTVTTSAATLFVCATDGLSWSSLASGASGIPIGSIILILTGICPSGYTEAAALNGKMLRGTIAANADVGTTGGNDSITPTGTVAPPAFTGNSVVSSAVTAGTPAGTNATGTVTPLGTIAWPAGVPLFTGNALATHTHTFTGSALATHAHELPWQIPSTTTIRQIAVATFGTGTSRAATAVSAAGTANTTSAAVALSQAVTAGTPAGTNAAITAGTPAGTIAWPAGVPTFGGSSSVTSAEVFTGAALSTHTHTTTATGTNTAPIFTGAAFDNRAAYTNVIFCSKN